MNARDWVITYRARGRGSRVQVWAVIEDVPGEVDEAGVSAALESWQRWPLWQARVAPGAVLAVRRRRAADELPVTVIGWATLSPAVKRVQTNVSGELYAAIVRAAKLEGASLQAWSVAAFAAYAGRPELVTLEARPPAFVDVPLPLDDEAAAS